MSPTYFFRHQHIKMDAMILFQVFESLKNQIWWYGQAYQNMRQSKECSYEPMLSRDFSFCEFYFLILFFLLNTEMDQFEEDLFDFESYRKAHPDCINSQHG